MGQEFVARNGLIALKNSSISGSLTVSQGVSSSLYGTSSWSTQALSASYYSGVPSTSSYSQTSSYATQANSSSYALTASYPLFGVITASAANTTITFTRGDGTSFSVTVAQSGSVATASYALVAEQAQTASYYGGSVVSSSYALTSSYATNFYVSGTQQMGDTTFSYTAPLQIGSTISGPGGFNTGIVIKGFAPMIVFEDVNANDVALAGENGDFFLYGGASATTQIARWSTTNLNTDTNIIFTSDNARDIGASGATRPRIIYVGTSVVSPAFSGSLHGTASVASNAITASNANTASYYGGSVVSSSWAISSSYAQTAQTLLGTVQSASYALTASYSNNATSASYSLNSTSASYSLNSTSASFASVSVSSSYAATSSVAISASAYRESDPVFTSLSASLATTGSNIFRGDITITGSLRSSGSVVITGPLTATNFTGSLFGTSSWALNAISSSYSFNSTTSSYSLSGLSSSYSLNSNSSSYSLNSTSASYSLSGLSSSYSLNSTSASYSLNSTSASYSLNSNSSSYSLSSSYGRNSLSSSYSLTSTSSSYAATASLLLGSVVSASYALSASWAPGGTGATPGGPNTTIQFNDSNTFSGSGNFTYNKTTSAVVLTGSMYVTASSLGTIFNIDTTVPNTFYVSASGRVAMGTNDPQSLFHLKTSVAQQLFRLENTVTNNYTTFAFQGTGRTFYIGVGNNAESFFGVADKFHIYDANANGIRLVIDTNGRMGLGGQTAPSYMLDVTGDGRFTSTLTANLFTEVSSLRYKKNVETINNQLDSVLKLKPVTYQLKESTEEKREYGLIAEEVAKVYPEFVKYDENGDPDSVQYSRLVVVLIDCVQELKKEVDFLKNKLRD